MNTARLMLPSLLLLYFLWRSLRHRVFLLGLPFLMDMYYSVFFQGLKPFWVPSTWAPADHMMFWLLATWIVYFDLLLPWSRRTVRQRGVFGPRLSLPEELVLLGFASYVVLKIGTTAVHHVDLWSAASQARLTLYLFAGYFLLRGIFSHAGREETVRFVAAIVVVNSIAALLYVLHQGLHVGNIYVAVTEYQQLVFDGQVLTRSFYFMPQYLTLAIAFCMAKRDWSVFWLAVLVVTVAAVWVSYTRALLIVAVVEIAVILLLRLVKRPDAWQAAKRTLQIGVVMAVFVGTAVALMPTQSAYLFSRLSETRSSGGVAQTGNIEVRLQWWRTTYEWVGDENHLMGVGFPSLAQEPRVMRIGEMAADTIWVPTVWNLGLLGVAGLTVLFFAYGWRATRLSLASSDDAAFLPTVVVGVIVATFLLGFVEWTILDPWHTPNALWFMALIVAERCWHREESGGAKEARRHEPALVSGGDGEPAGAPR